ncbi:MAG: ArsS family sensor histidine kinase [Campylobacteraceae bacterium]|nr:ArsS family sensor histidine kinase [Campylobacteraceae bacterium]
MKNYSLGAKVSISFAFCLLFIFILFITFYRYENELNIRKFKDEHIQSISYFLTLYRSDVAHEEIGRYFENFRLKAVPNELVQDIVLKRGNIIFQQNANHVKFSAIIYNNTYYLLVEHSPVEILFESQEKLPSNNFFLIVFLIIFMLILWLYISTMKSIRPIRELRKAVRQFANGNMDVVCSYNKTDEIGEVSQEFNKAVQMIKNLLRSRTLFLRTIMHELKTPIGKGRIVSEMIDDELQKNRMIKIFKRLEILINEFAKIEQITTKNYKTNKNVHDIREIFDMVFSVLLLEPDQLSKKVKLSLGKGAFPINVDLELMALVFKNLIDNALKYGSNHSVQITLKKNVITFSNKGEPLAQPIEEYRQAFITSANRENKNGGMGLGLYIVDSILTMHDLKLVYEYVNEHHHFSINLIGA